MIAKSRNFDIKIYKLRMSLEARKLQLFEEILSINSEVIIEKLEHVLEEEHLDPTVQELMESRALKAEEDIKAGRVYTLEEAEAKLNEQLGL